MTITNDMNRAIALLHQLLLPDRIQYFKKKLRGDFEMELRMGNLSVAISDNPQAIIF